MEKSKIINSYHEILPEGSVSHLHVFVCVYYRDQMHLYFIWAELAFDFAFSPVQFGALSLFSLSHICIRCCLVFLLLRFSSYVLSLHVFDACLLASLHLEDTLATSFISFRLCFRIHLHSSFPQSFSLQQYKRYHGKWKSGGVSVCTYAAKRKIFTVHKVNKSGWKRLLFWFRVRECA